MSVETTGSKSGGGTMARGFLPGLVLGLIVGAFAGAVLPDLINGQKLPGPASGPANPGATSERDAELRPPAEEPPIPGEEGEAPGDTETPPTDDGETDPDGSGG